MKFPHNPLPLLAGALLFAGIPFNAPGQVLSWDPTQSGGAGGGTGNWNTTPTDTFWWDGVSQVAWPTSPSSPSEAVFAGGTAGTVTVVSDVQTDALTFNTGGYTLADGGGSIDDNGGGLAFTAPMGATTTTTIGATIAGTGDWNFNFDANPSGAPIATFVLDGTNTRDGDLTLNDPPGAGGNRRLIVQFNSVSALGATSNSVNLNDRTRLMAGTSLTLQHTVVFGGTGTLGVVDGETLTIDDASLLSGDVRFENGTIALTDGTLSGNKNFDLVGSGAGSSTIVRVDVAGALGDGGIVEFELGGGTQTLEIATDMTYDGTLRTRTNNSAFVEVNPGVTFTLGGTIATANSARDLTKIGTGTWVLTADSPGFAPGGAGGVYVNEGTLSVENPTGTGTGSGFLVVADGARLQGDGIINTDGLAGDEITVNGTIAPGTSIGTLTIGDSGNPDEDVTLSGAGSTFEVEFDGINSDLLDVYGSLTLDSDVVLSLNNFGSGAQIGQVYTIASYTSLTGTFTPGLIANNTGLLLDNTFGTGGIDYDYLSGGDIAVRFAAIPEPGTVALLAIAAFVAGIGIWRRRSARA